MASLQEVTRNKLDLSSIQQNAGRVSSVLSRVKGDTNVGMLERWASGIGGGLLTFYAFIRRDWIGAILALVGADFILRGLTGHCYIYQALGISTAGQKNSASVRHNRGIKVERAVTINKLPGELYRFWRNFENLPRFTEYLEDVKVIDDKRSHWTAKGPAGSEAEWDAHRDALPGDRGCLEGNRVLQEGLRRERDRPVSDARWDPDARDDPDRGLRDHDVG